MLESQASPPRPGENQNREFIDALTRRLSAELERCWFHPELIASVLKNGLASLSDFDSQTLQDLQLAALDVHRSDLIGFFVSRGCGEDEAEERTAACFERMTDAVRGGTVLYHPKAFAFRVARNYHTNENKRHANRVLHLDAGVANAVVSKELAPPDAASLAEVSRTYDSDEETFKASLDAEESQLLRLRQDLYTHAEIVRETGWDETRYDRIRKRLERKGKKFGMGIPKKNRKKPPLAN